MRRQVLPGMKFGKLTTVSRFSRRCAGNRQKYFWNCKCDCGSTSVADHSDLVSGNTKSCGCLMREINASKHFIHGQSHTPLHNIWMGIIDRCTNENSPPFKNYGGRGIKICNEWKTSFVAFAEYVGSRPSSRHSIDRIDNDGDYCPGNVRWATRAEQNRNSRKNITFVFEGKILCLAEIARLANVPYRRIHARIFAYGWPFEKAIATPLTSSKGTHHEKYT